VTVPLPHLDRRAVGHPQRDGGDLARTRRLGRVRFEQALRREITKRGGQKPGLRIAGRLFAALTDPAGVTARRRGALERVGLPLVDWSRIGRADWAGGSGLRRRGCADVRIPAG
jgi:hypothetical protein